MSEELYLNVAVVGADINATADYHKVMDLINSIKLRHREKIFLTYHHTFPRLTYDNTVAIRSNRSSWRNTALTRIYNDYGILLKNYCDDVHAKGEKAMVYYLHSKGSCCWKGKEKPEYNPVAAWRDLMNTLNIEFPSIRMRALLNGYGACGTEGYERHFAVNIWWATSY